MKYTHCIVHLCQSLTYIYHYGAVSNSRSESTDPIFTLRSYWYSYNHVQCECDLGHPGEGIICHISGGVKEEGKNRQETGCGVIYSLEEGKSWVMYVLRGRGVEECREVCLVV